MIKDIFQFCVCVLLLLGMDRSEGFIYRKESKKI